MKEALIIIQEYHPHETLPKGAQLTQEQCWGDYVAMDVAVMAGGTGVVLEYDDSYHDKSEYKIQGIVDYFKQRYGEENVEVKKKYLSHGDEFAF